MSESPTKRKTLSAGLASQKVLQNPFHPLDLSAYDLLTVYKKFDILREANRNPKHELPIETVAQLISSLKGCKPSYVQKCMSQALIKDHLSWNEFLAFLDQESEIRYKILDWLIHEKAIIRYKFKNELPFRGKIANNYEFISSLNFISLGEDRLLLASIDHRHVFLINSSEGKFETIDQLIHTNKKYEQKKPANNSVQQVLMHNVSTLDRRGIRKSKNQNKQRGLSLNNKSAHLRAETIHITNEASTPVNNPLFKSTIDEQSFLRRQRKNIHTLFNLFVDLPLQQSKKMAELATDKIRSRTINVNAVNQIKQTYEGFITETKPEVKSFGGNQQKPLERAHRMLRSLHQQKTVLSYNPYKTYRITKMSSDGSETMWNSHQKKLNFDRKQKQYHLQSIHEKYCPELECLANVYYNYELCLVKIVREYNKIKFEKQGSLRISPEKDYKKNQIIQMIQFYYHQTTGKWFLLVLFRNEHKHQSRTHNESYVKGYEIGLQETKRKGETRYVFAKDREDFVIELGKNQIIRMLAQKQYGLHLITHNGKYLAWREDYQRAQKEVSYWRRDFEEKFKGMLLSFSCMAISSKLNKAVLGTIKGVMIVYDLFSKQYKLNKICNSAILQIEIQQDQACILSENQKIIIYDIVRNEQVQTLSVKSEEKLHDKVDKFVLHQDRIVCYGTCVRVFEQYVDESLQQQKFKLENIYTWRLNKLDKARGNTEAPLKLIPTFRKDKTNAELVQRSQNLFVVLTQIQQVIFYSIDKLQVKFTTILDIPHDEKVMRMTISRDEKLLAVLLYSQVIYVFNIYTQEEVLKCKPLPFKKYTTISFLDGKNEYLMAAGIETGKILLIPFQLNYEKQAKNLEFHSRPITLTTLTGETLVTASQNQQLVIWQLPFNVLKHQIKLKAKLAADDYVTDKLGFHLETTYFRTSKGLILEINTAKGEIKSISSEFVKYSHISVDVSMGYLFGVEAQGEVVVLERNAQGAWAVRKKFAIDAKSQVIGIGLVYSQKAVIFTKTGLYVWAYRNDRVSKFKSFLECIV